MKKSAEDMKDTLRYKHMVARHQDLPPYKKEAALLQEIAKGRQWRIDAVLEAIDKKEEWRYINVTNVMKQAAMFGRLGTVRRIAETLGYEKGEDAVAQTPVQAAFHVATLHGHYRTADVLSEYGAGPDYESGDRTPPAAHWAVQEGNLRKIDYLIKKGANPDYMVFLASAQADMKVIKHLVEEKGAGVNFAAEGFWTPFLNAIKYDREELADYLLEKGATPQNDRGAREAIYTAVRQGKPALVSKLIGLGIKPDADDLNSAIHDGHLDVAKVLVEEGGLKADAGKQEALLLATVSKKPEEAVKFAIDNGAAPEKAIAALKEDPGLYKYGNRDKMLAYLEENFPQKAEEPKVEAPKAEEKPAVEAPVAKTEDKPKKPAVEEKPAKLTDEDLKGTKFETDFNTVFLPAIKSAWDVPAIDPALKEALGLSGSVTKTDKGLDLTLANGHRIQWLQDLDGGEFIGNAHKSENPEFDASDARAVVAASKSRGWKAINVHGDQQQRENMWLEAQRQGLKVANFSPEADSEVRKQWEKEQAARIAAQNTPKGNRPGA